jgi:metal-sulfur cluster biosynthetic enzyme
MDETLTADREQAAWDALSQVIDPELGLPVTDLGLVYGVEIEGSSVSVDMTTTTPVCPLGTYLTQMAETKLLEIPGVDRVAVRLVTEPMWSPEMMSDRARQVLRIP